MAFYVNLAQVSIIVGVFVTAFQTYSSCNAISLVVTLQRTILQFCRTQIPAAQFRLRPQIDIHIIKMKN